MLTFIFKSLMRRRVVRMAFCETCCLFRSQIPVEFGRHYVGLGKLLIQVARGFSFGPRKLKTSSTEIKIPRYIRKLKNREQIERYSLVKRLALEKKFECAFLNMEAWLNSSSCLTDTKSTTLILNGLLHSLCDNSKHEEIARLKKIMDKLRLSGDRSTYAVLIDNFGKQGDLKMVENLLKEMECIGLEPHGRSYGTVVRLLVENNRFAEAMEYFMKMESLYKEKDDEFCSWLVKRLTQVGHFEYVENIFGNFKDNETRLGKEMVLATRKYFESLSTSSEWKMGMTTVSPSGQCLKCQEKLERPKFNKQAEQLESYLRSLINKKLVDKGGRGHCDTELSQYGQKTWHLVDYLNNNGPFDIIVDGLNVAMHPSHGFNFSPLLRLAEYFSSRGKRVLIMAANELVSPKQSNPMAVAEHQNGVRSLRKLSNIYLVKRSQSGIDDLFLLFAVLHSSRTCSDVKLLSNDRFMDHRNAMKPQMAVDFERWLQTHQVQVKRFESRSGRPIFKNPPEYAIVVQKSAKAWHFPSIDGKTWLCIERETSVFKK